MKYTVTRKGDHALINRDITKALNGPGMVKAVVEKTNRARNEYVKRAPVELRGSTSVGTETRKDRRIGVVHVAHRRAMGHEFGAKTGARGRGTHLMRHVAEYLNKGYYDDRKE